MGVDSESDVTIDGDPLPNPPALNSNKSDCLWSAKLTESDTHQSDRCETEGDQNDLDLYRLCPSQSSYDVLVLSSPVAKPLQTTVGLSCASPSGSSSTLFGSGLMSPSTAAGSI